MFSSEGAAADGKNVQLCHWEVLKLLYTVVYLEVVVGVFYHLLHERDPRPRLDPQDARQSPVQPELDDHDGDFSDQGEPGQDISLVLNANFLVCNFQYSIRYLLSHDLLLYCLHLHRPLNL